MILSLKLSGNENVDPKDLNTLRDNKYHNVKITTTRLEIKKDRRDDTVIASLRNVKLAYEDATGGIVVFLGSLQCDWKQPYGGAFYAVRKIVDKSSKFNDIQGVEAKIKFVSDGGELTRNDEMSAYLKLISEHKKFVFNLNQFDEFMDIFKFYQSLSDELSNNVNYKIVSKSEPYYYVSADVKTTNIIDKEEITDQNGVIKGYKFPVTEFVHLKNDVKEKVRQLIDIHILGGHAEIAKIHRIGEENVYVSNFSSISEKDVKGLKSFIVVNSLIKKDEVVLSGEMKTSSEYNEKYEYLNLYDMGQKIKIESIDNSLRLINQGATGAAAELLEYLIGDKKMPNARRSILSNLKKEKYMEGLNESQRKAFLMAVDGSPVSLIKGPPGTGKTHVINAIVQYITKELDEKVVVSSQTHIAIDNVLDKLIENYDLIIPNRITNRRNRYGQDYIDETLYNTWGRKFFVHNQRASNKKLSEAIAEDMRKFNGEGKFKYSSETNTNEFSVIGATTTTSAIAGKKGLETLKGYDWLIIDEVSKCPITEVLRYLPYVSKIIMVGDDFQLAPLLEFSKEEVKNLPSYDEDKFEKLKAIYEQSVFAKVLDKAKDANRLVVLNENYRSVKQVLSVYNFFYDKSLIGKRETINPYKVQFIDNDFHYNEHDAFFIDVKNGQEVREGTSRYNIEEIKATSFMLRDLIKKVKDPQNVSVSAIFPYAAQINKFQKMNLQLCNQAKKTFKSFEIDTVDAFQGKETDIVLVNTVIADSSQRNFMNDFRRINVAMSRAKDKLFIFGNPFVLSRIKMKVKDGSEINYFKNIIEFIESEGGNIKFKGDDVVYENKRSDSFKLA